MIFYSLLVCSLIAMVLIYFNFFKTVKKNIIIPPIPIGQIWDGTKITKCYTGENWDGEKCITCGRGQNWDGKQCVTCASGQNWDGKQCIICASGQNWDGKQCVTCEPGKNWDGEQCIICGNDKIIENSKCNIPPVGISKNYTLVNGIDFTKESGVKTSTQLNQFVEDNDGIYWSWDNEKKYRYCKKDCAFIKNYNHDGVVLVRM